MHSKYLNILNFDNEINIVEPHILEKILNKTTTYQKNYYKEYYEKNSKKMIENSRRWRLSHVEENKAYKKAYYLKYKDIINERSKKYYHEITKKNKLIV